MNGPTFASTPTPTAISRMRPRPISSSTRTSSRLIGTSAFISRPRPWKRCSEKVTSPPKRWPRWPRGWGRIKRLREQWALELFFWVPESSNRLEFAGGAYVTGRQHVHVLRHDNTRAASGAFIHAGRIFPGRRWSDFRDRGRGAEVYATAAVIAGRQFPVRL